METSDSSTEEVADVEEEPGTSEKDDDCAISSGELEAFRRHIARKAVRIARKNKRARASLLDVHQALWQILGKQKPKGVSLKEKWKKWNVTKAYLTSGRRHRAFAAIMRAMRNNDPDSVPVSEKIETSMRELLDEHTDGKLCSAVEGTKETNSNIDQPGTSKACGSTYQEMDNLAYEDSSDELEEITPEALEGLSDESLETSILRDIEALDEVESDIVEAYVAKLTSPRFRKSTPKLQRVEEKSISEVGDEQEGGANKAFSEQLPGIERISEIIDLKDSGNEEIVEPSGMVDKSQQNTSEFSGESRSNAESFNRKVDLEKGFGEEELTKLIVNVSLEENDDVEIQEVGNPPTTTSLPESADEVLMEVDKENKDFIATTSGGRRRKSGDSSDGKSGKKAKRARSDIGFQGSVEEIGDVVSPNSSLR